MRKAGSSQQEYHSTCAVTLCRTFNYPRHLSLNSTQAFSSRRVRQRPTPHVLVNHNSRDRSPRAQARQVEQAGTDLFGGTLLGLKATATDLVYQRKDSSPGRAICSCHHYRKAEEESRPDYMPSSDRRPSSGGPPSRKFRSRMPGNLPFKESFSLFS